MKLTELLENRTGVAFGELPADAKNFPRIGWIAAPETTTPFNQERMIDHVANLDYVLIDLQCFRLSATPYLLRALPSKLLQGGHLIISTQGQTQEAPNLELLKAVHEIRSNVPGMEFLKEWELAGCTYEVFVNRNPASPGRTRENEPARPEFGPLLHRAVDRLDSGLARYPKTQAALAQTALRGWRTLKWIKKVTR